MPDDVGDHKFYLAGAAAILDEYPREVQDIISDPRTGTRLLKPFPSLHDLRQACDKAFEPLQREMERQAAKSSIASTRRLSAPPRRPRSAEEQERINTLVAESRKKLGIPPEGLGPKQVRLKTATGDGRHFDRIRRDLEARQARNAERAQSSENASGP